MCNVGNLWISEASLSKLEKIQHSLALPSKCIFPYKQECIPVGCVLAAHWPYAGVCFLGGGCVCFWGCVLPRGHASWMCVCVLLRGCVCFLGGVCFPGGCMHASGGVHSSGGGGIPACTEADPVNGITDMSKNITMVTTSLRPVKISHWCPHLNFNRNYRYRRF